MRVGIDASPLIAETPSGIDVYLLECLRNFKVDDGNVYFLYSHAPLQKGVMKAIPGVYHSYFLSRKRWDLKTDARR